MGTYDVGRVADRLIKSNSLRLDIERSIEERLQHLAPFCESPIELMLLGMFDFSMALGRYTGQALNFEIRKQSDPATPLEWPFIVIIPQYCWREYRVDFAFFTKDLVTPVVFVECDGHDFHERTPEQAERDRRRDRVVQEAGIVILRFTGRELNRDAFDCGIQVIDCLWRQS